MGLFRKRSSSSAQARGPAAATPLAGALQATMVLDRNPAAVHSLGGREHLDALGMPVQLPSNLPPPPTPGISTEEALETSITVPVVMGRERSLGMGLNSDNIVTSVALGSAAAKAGIRLGDIVLGWQGTALKEKRLQDVLRPSPVHILSIARGNALVSSRGEGGAASSSGGEGGAGGVCAGASAVSDRDYEAALEAAAARRAREVAATQPRVVGSAAVPTAAAAVASQAAGPASPLRAGTHAACACGGDGGGGREGARGMAAAPVEAGSGFGAYGCGMSSGASESWLIHSGAFWMPWEWRRATPVRNLENLCTSCECSTSVVLSGAYM